MAKFISLWAIVLVIVCACAGVSADVLDQSAVITGGSGDSFHIAARLRNRFSWTFDVS